MRSYIRSLWVSVVCAVVLLGAPGVAVADEDPTPPPTTTTTSTPPPPTTTVPEQATQATTTPTETSPATTEPTTAPPEPTTTTTSPQESDQPTQTTTPPPEPTETTTSTTTAAPEPEQTTQTTSTPVPQEMSAPTSTTTTPEPVIEPTPTSSSPPSSEPLTISVSPTSGPPATEVAVRGTGWTHQVYADGVEVEISQNYGNGQLTRLTSAKSGPPDASGVFSLQMTIPADAKPGLLSISPITGGPEIADALFTVTGGGPPSGQQQTQPTVTLSPSEGPPGTVTTADGHGFNPNQPVTVTQSGGPQITGGGGTVQADQSGSIKMSFGIADQTPPGAITVTFTQGPNVATAQLQVTARQPGPNVNSGQPGQNVNNGQPGQNANSGKPFGIKDVSTHNYSGYSAAPGKYTSASARFTIPVKSEEISCTIGQSNDGFWVGLGAASKRDLEQLGITTNCVNGVLTRQAFYELIANTKAPGPQVLNPFTYPVTDGDNMEAIVAFAGGNTFNFTLHNYSRSWTFTKSVDQSSQWDPTSGLASADFIAEAPGDQLSPLLNFGTIHFEDCFANDTPLGSLPLQRWEMDANDGAVKANASPVSTVGNNGHGPQFDIVWRSAGP